MTATKITATALGCSPHDGKPHPCGLCGTESPARPWEQVLKPTFTNIDELRADHVCWACQACLNDKRTRSSFLVDAAGSYRKLARPDVWRMLLDPPPTPFVCYLTHSGKKHGLFRQKTATQRERFRLQCEHLHAWHVPEQAAPWMAAMARLLVEGANRERIANGRYDAGDYHRVGLARLRTLDAIIKPMRPTDHFAIIHGLMPAVKILKGDEPWLSTLWKHVD